MMLYEMFHGIQNGGSPIDKHFHIRGQSVNQKPPNPIVVEHLAAKLDLLQIIHQSHRISRGRAPVNTQGILCPVE